MNLSDKLEIVLITYNRKDFLAKTLEELFSEKSPVRELKITILNNNSDDGTSELINSYCETHKNIVHIINKKNIGGCANIAKAFVEIPEKEYVWVLCDNDTYDWTAWEEVLDGIKNEKDVIFVRNCKNNTAEMFYTASLVSACIYKTNMITDTVVENIYDYVKFLFPHLAIIAQAINHNKLIHILTKHIVYSGINPGHDTTFVRGLEKKDLPESRRNIFWSVGFFNSVELINDKKQREFVINGVRHYHKSLYELFKTAMIKNKIHYNNYFYNFFQIYRVLNFIQRIKLVFAYFIVNLSFKNYKFYEIRSKKQWEEYFEQINEQEYLDKLAKKLKGKKVILYGAGIIAEVLLEKYNLSDFNIIGVCDKKFERTEEKDFYGISTIVPDNLKNEEFDTVLFTLKLHKKIAKILEQSGIKQKKYSILKKNFKYAVRT